MLGVTLKTDETDRYLDLDILPDLVKQKVEASDIHELIQKSEFKHFFIFDENIIDAVNSYKSSDENGVSSIIENRIGERRDSQIRCRIVEDQLTALLTVTTGYAGKLPTIDSLLKELLILV